MVQRKHARSEDLLLLTACLLAIFFVLWHSNSDLGLMLLMMLSFPLMVWICLRYSLRVVTISSVIVTALIILISSTGHGLVHHLNIAVIASGALSMLILYAMRSERNALIEQLHTQATTDSLTQLSNRHSFIQQSSAALAQAKRHGYPISLVMLDVDHFKGINDQYGHATGDEALRTLARCCKETRRPGDLVGRLGGEEFVLLLPHTDGSEAKAIADRLRNLVQAQQIENTEGTGISITFSAGAAEAKPDEFLEQFMHRADTAIYAAKQAGRNQVLLAGN